MDNSINKDQYDFLIDFILNSKKIESNSDLNRSIKNIRLLKLEEIEMLLEKHDRLSPSVCFKVDSNLSYNDRINEVKDFLKIINLDKYIANDSKGRFALEASVINIIQEYEEVQEEIDSAHEANLLSKKANDIAEKALNKSQTSNVIAILSALIAALSLIAAVVAIILNT